jgi:hypothetical protein
VLARGREKHSAVCAQSLTCMASRINPWSELGAPKTQAPVQGERQYVLIDAAQVDRLNDRLPNLGSVSRHESVFAAPIAPSLADASPHVLEVSGENAYGDLLRGDFADAVAFFGALTWLVSPLSLSDLAARLRLRLDAQLPDRFDCVNRFFDARIAPHLHECLTGRQRVEFFSVSTQWWVVSHTHAWQSLACSFSSGDPFTAPLALDEAQQAFMIDACYPYSVIDHFRETDEELLNQVPASEHYGLFRRALEVASDYGIDGGATAILFCTLILTRGPTFYEQPEWRIALERVKRGEITLQQAVKAQHA